MENEIKKSQQVIITSTKSVGMAIILILVLGPIGMFYSTVSGAMLFLLITIVLSVVAIAINPFLLAVVLPVMWIVSLVWGAKAVKSYNAGLLEQA